MKGFNILILLVLISSLFPYQVIADDGQDIQIALSSLDEGHGYFSLDKTATSPNQFVSNPYFIGQEVVDMRTENSKTVYLGKVGKNDKYSLDVSMGPIHYKDDYSNSNEQWKDIDLTFVDGKITKAPYELTVDGNTIVVRDKKTNSIVALTLSEIGAKSVSTPNLVYSKGKATAQNIALDTDLEISADNSRVRFTRILKSNKAPVESKFGISQTGTGINVDYQAVESGAKPDKDVKVNASLKYGVLTESVDTLGLTYPVRIDPTLDLQVTTNNDCAKVYWNGGDWIGVIGGVSAHYSGYYDATIYKSGTGQRFLNVTIPNAASITTAYLNFTGIFANSTIAVNTKIVGDDEDNSATFTTLADYQARRGTDVGGADDTKRTTAEVAWTNISAWSVDENSADTQSPEIKTVVQEIVNRAGWASGNAMTLFWDDHANASTGGIRVAYAYVDSAVKAPILHIEYVYGSTISSIAASSVEETTATVGGNVTAMGGGNITSYGIQYGNTTLYGSWCNVTETKTAIFTYYCYLGTNTSALDPGELYYYRAWTYDNVAGYGYGAQLTFQTKPYEPTGLTTTTVNTTAISMTWTRGAGALNTVIAYDNVGYPATPAAGTLSYNGTGTSNTQGGLSGGTWYYFRAWSWASEGASATYSDLYSSSSSKTYLAPTVTTIAPSGYGNDWVSVSGNQTNGDPASTVFGFQYGPTIAYGSWSNTTTTVSGGMFSATISGLTPSSSYHYRAFAANPYGIGYGADMTFSTAGTAILYESHLYGCNTTWSQLYESTASNITSNYTATQVFGNNWTAQTFTTTQSHSVHQIVLWASRSATAAAGYMYVSIREATTDNVTSPDLAIGLYSIGYVSTTGGSIEVSLENEIQLDTTKKYAIVVRAPGADSTNYVSLWSSNTSGTSIYAGGNAIRSVNGGGVWQSYTGYDVFFSIIGRPQPIYGNVQAAQSFTVGASPHTAYKIRLILGRIGQPGNVYVSIRNYTGGVISNADLAVVALNGNAVTLDKASYDCVLVPEKSLEAGKQYAIVVMAPSGDRYNYILMCADTGAGYAGGTALMSIDSGITWTIQTFDYNFEIWGNACLNVLNAKVFKNYLVTGDWLITAETLNVSPPYYDSNQDPSTLFILSFMGLTGTTYASTPCELWGKGPIVIYLNPTQASALTWGGNYKVRLSDLTGTVYSEYGLLPTDWSASSLIYLDNWVRLVAKDMEAYQTARTGATVTYLTYVADKGYVLNQDGGAIFNQACPRLSYVRPNIFQVTSNTPDIPTTSTPMPGTTGTHQERLGSYISGLLDQGARASGVGDTKTFGGLLMVAIYFIIAFGTVTKGFAWAGLISAFPIILIGMYYRLLDVQMLIVILVIMLFLFVREFFWKGG